MNKKKRNLIDKIAINAMKVLLKESNKDYELIAKESYMMANEMVFARHNNTINEINNDVLKDELLKNGFTTIRGKRYTINDIGHLTFEEIRNI